MLLRFRVLGWGRPLKTKLWALTASRPSGEHLQESLLTMGLVQNLGEHFNVLISFFLLASHILFPKPYTLNLKNLSP